MIHQTVRIVLANGEAQDISPLGSGTTICGMTFVDKATKEFRAVPDGALKFATDANGDTVFRLTAPAAMDGFLCFGESPANYPNGIDFST